MKHRRRGKSGKPGRINRLLLGLVILTMIGVSNALTSPIYTNDDWTSQADVNVYNPALTWQTNAFATIKQAILNVSPGGTVHVLEGTYNEDLTVDRSVTLDGAGSTLVNVNGIHRITNSAVRIEGFTFVPVGNYGITIDSTAAPRSNIEITQCVFTLAGYSGVHIGGEAGTPNKVSDVTMSYNTFNGPASMAANPWKIGGYFGQPVGCEVEGVNFEYNTVNRCSIPINLHDKDITDVFIYNNIFRNTDGCVYVWEDAGQNPTGVLSQFVFANNDVDSTNTYGVGIDPVGGVFTDANFGDGNWITYNNFVGIIGGYGFEAVSTLATLTGYILDAENNWWGDASGPGGAGPGSGCGVSANVDYSPWLTAPITNCMVGTGVTLDNTNAGVKVDLSGGTGNPYLGSAEYTSAPPCISTLPGVDAHKYVDAFQRGYAGTSAVAQITVAYDPTITGALENTLKLYLYDGTNWIEGSGITRSPALNVVQGTFLASLLTGVPIALAGDDYSVTILPPEAPGLPRVTKPTFTTFTIESATTNIGNVYYQIDNYSPTGWKAIQSNVNALTWNWPGWAISDAEWAGLSTGTHTYYFMFTRTGGGSTVGASGEISWQFFKAAVLPTMLTVTSPTTGDVLNRDPFTIMWTLASTTDIEYITIYYSQNNGVTYPHTIARIYGTDPVLDRYVWRSPNVGVNEGKIKVVVRYRDGTEYSDESETFRIVKGFSMTSWRPGSGYTSFWSGGRQGYSFSAG